MCGLAGVILDRKRRRCEELRVVGGVLTELLLLSQRRGTDAAGVAVIRQNRRYRLLKRPGPAAGLVSDKLYWRVLDLDNKVTIILGHTRQKTRGSERNNRNNHPIVVCRRLCATHYAESAVMLSDDTQVPAADGVRRSPAAHDLCLFCRIPLAFLMLLSGEYPPRLGGASRQREKRHVRIGRDRRRQ